MIAVSHRNSSSRYRSNVSDISRMCAVADMTSFGTSAMSSLQYELIIITPLIDCDR